MERKVALLILYRTDRQEKELSWNHKTNKEFVKQSSMDDDALN